jgi:3' exoribonuclease, RNase T-like
VTNAKVFYDTEFLEDGKTIELISIGMAAEDGRELYLVNRDAPWKRIKKNDWLMANVVPSLPQPHGDWINQMPKSWPIDFHNPAVMAKADIAQAVRAFLLAVPDVELWAWYGAYDHVVLAQLFGRMIDLPRGVPMWTNDLRQEMYRLGDPEGGPVQECGEHNALEDARHLKARVEWLAGVAQ